MWSAIGSCVSSINLSSCGGGESNEHDAAQAAITDTAPQSVLKAEAESIICRNGFGRAWHA